MFKRIIAGVLSTVICSSAITSGTVGTNAWAVTAKSGQSSEAENRSMAAAMELSDDHLSVTANTDDYTLQSSDYDASSIESIISDTVALGIRVGETNDQSETTESSGKPAQRPIIHFLPDTSEKCDTVELGENIKADIYSSGLLRIYGHGEMKDFSKCPFANAADITQVLFEDTDAENGLVITNIGKNLFKGMSSLNSSAYGDISKAEENIFVIPDSIQSIGAYAFAGCSSIVGIQFGSKLETIGEYAFNNCTGITKLTIPSSVTSMSANMLNGCTKLKELTLPYAATIKDRTIEGNETDWASSVADLFFNPW
ncbi:leucine-rich repeat domain-containing protein, partial [Ruminococcus sp.]